MRRIGREARQVFNGMSRRTHLGLRYLGVTVRTDSTKKLLRCSEKWKRKISTVCFGTVLKACGGLAAVRLGKEVHGQYVIM